MKTLVTESIKKAARFIRNGDVVAFPTETVYGLGANVFDSDAVRKIYAAKGRTFDNPLIVHVASKSEINNLALEIPKLAQNIINDMFPGPITVILRKNEIISGLVTSGLDTIAVRMPASKIARDFIKACGVPIAAPSANLSGSPSPTTYLHVLEDFDGKIPCVLKGPNAKHGLESTVIDCTSALPHILRPGVVTLEDLRTYGNKVRYATRAGRIKSPGTKYKHYSPKAKVIVSSDLKIKNLNLQDAGYIGLDKSARTLGFRNVMICKDLNDYAKNLFAFLRLCDNDKIRIIYCEQVETEGIGMAIMNRLKKASS